MRPVLDKNQTKPCAVKNLPSPITEPAHSKRMKMKNDDEKEGWNDENEGFPEQFAPEPFRQYIQPYNGTGWDHNWRQLI